MSILGSLNLDYNGAGHACFMTKWACFIRSISKKVPVDCYWFFLFMEMKKKSPDIITERMENSPSQSKQSILSGFDRLLKNHRPTLSVVNIRLILNSETRLLPTAKTVWWVSKSHSSPSRAGLEHLCRSGCCCALAPLGGVSEPDVDPTPYIPAG